MHYGVIEVAKAASERITQLDTVANNLANASTPGFKMENFYPASPDGKAAKEGPIYSESRVVTDYSQGAFQQTKNALDLAIEGDGFFAVQTKDGTAYTRKGTFVLNRQRQIVTLSGDYVLGEKGPVTLPSENFSINASGGIIVDGSEVARLRVVGFANPQSLFRTRNGMFRDPGQAGAKKIGNPSLKSGYIEISNVNVVTQMVKMIDVQRSFESYQKIIQTLADLDDLAVNRVGRVA